MKRTLLLLTVSVALFSCKDDKKAPDATVAGVQAVSLDAARPQIAAANAAFGKAMITGDSAAVTALYHSQGQAFPPDGPATDGKGMGAMSRFVAGMQLASFDVTTDELTVAGDMIIEKGHWTLNSTNKELDKGKSLVIWKQEGGQWKMWRDMWNSDKAPGAAGH
ncbi:MAG: nuclear transport factor 2 family protein [Chitinophagaceae bacterium]|nr:MAG: nuclear transport factor 2 family protein [Chitinophagaceae bacterium]